MSLAISWSMLRQKLVSSGRSLSSTPSRYSTPSAVVALAQSFDGGSEEGDIQAVDEFPVAEGVEAVVGLLALAVGEVAGHGPFGVDVPLRCFDAQPAAGWLDGAEAAEKRALSK